MKTNIAINIKRISEFLFFAGMYFFGWLSVFGFIGIGRYIAHGTIYLNDKSIEVILVDMMNIAEKGMLSGVPVALFLGCIASYFIHFKDSMYTKDTQKNV